MSRGTPPLHVSFNQVTSKSNYRRQMSHNKKENQRTMTNAPSREVSKALVEVEGTYKVSMFLCRMIKAADTLHNMRRCIVIKLSI